MRWTCTWSWGSKDYSTWSRKILRCRHMTGAEIHGPCIEDDLKLQPGRGCEKWAGGGKAGATYRLRWVSQGDFSEILCVHKV